MRRLRTVVEIGFNRFQFADQMTTITVRQLRKFHAIRFNLKPVNIYENMNALRLPIDRIATATNR